VIEVNDCVPAKQFAPIVSIPAGITIELRLIHPKNIDAPNVFKFIPA
jgi:hypothetical protein